MKHLVYRKYIFSFIKSNNINKFQNQNDNYRK